MLAVKVLNPFTRQFGFKSPSLHVQPSAIFAQPFRLGAVFQVTTKCTAATARTAAARPAICAATGSVVNLVENGKRRHPPAV
jgi:hypothetical protein